MALSGATGAAAFGGMSGMAAAADGRDIYELRRYEIETPEQQKAFNAFMRDAAVPAFNRIGIKTVGVFEAPEKPGPIYVLLCHDSLASVGSTTQKLLADQEFLAKGATFLNAPSEDAAYKRVEISLLAAFSGMPRLERPTKAPGRVVQLRTYESPSMKTGQKKIEMFNTAEIAIFRKTGLQPVFFGECLAGPKMPNLTYMLAFDTMEQQKAAWKTFVNHPDWKKLSSIPEYADKRILCGITNLSLRPTEYSQI